MICKGCGKTASVTKTWFDPHMGWLEVCNAVDCGNLKSPVISDVYFRRPEFVENLADENNPHGMMIESKSHKARVLRSQGLREDGDRHHGAVEKGARFSRPKPSNEFSDKLKNTIRKNLGVLKRRP